MASSFNMMLSHSGHCAEAGEARYCEPYVLVTSIDLRSPHPDVEAFLYGPWERATSRDTADVAPLVWRESFWRLDIIAAPIANPDDVIFLVALMEHVNGNPSAARILVKKAVIEALGASAGMAREPRIAKLISDTNRAVDLANGGPNISSAIELLLTVEDVARLDTNGTHRFVRSFAGYGGDYCLNFELIRAESDAQDLVRQDEDAFFRAAE